MTRFLAVGHFCHDKTPYDFVLGGSAAYSAITARNLGCEASVVTSVGADFDRHHQALSGIEIVYRVAAETTVFHNAYDTDGNRQQMILGHAGELERRSIPRELWDVDIAYICPIADEVSDDVVGAFERSLVGITPQGWMRCWRGMGPVNPKRWQRAERILSASDVLILSEEDIAAHPEDLQRFIEWTPIVVLTRGSRGAQLFERGRVYEAKAYPVEAVDPTGAGDIFAASFLIWYHRSGSSLEALNFANCVASFAVEAAGTSGIPVLSAVVRRLKSGCTRPLRP